jgi:hypothetical protein
MNPTQSPQNRVFGRQAADVLTRYYRAMESSKRCFRLARFATDRQLASDLEQLGTDYAEQADRLRRLSNRDTLEIFAHMQMMERHAPT